MARKERTAEQKYFISAESAGSSLGLRLRVGFTHWNVVHSLRVSKSELGFRHFEGRHYTGLMRHLTLCLLTLTFVAGGTSGTINGSNVTGTTTVNFGNGVASSFNVVSKTQITATGPSRGRFVPHRQRQHAVRGHAAAASRHCRRDRRRHYLGPGRARPRHPHGAAAVNFDITAASSVTVSAGAGGTSQQKATLQGERVRGCARWSYQFPTRPATSLVAGSPLAFVIACLVR